MMWEYFGIREDPFGAVPDPRFLHLTEGHREALASLEYGFVSNRGFTSLIAAPGLGKTTLLFTFLEKIRAAARTVFIFDTCCDAGELITYILRDLAIPTGPDRVSQHEQLHSVLLAEARAGKKMVVVIDEAQNLSADALEALRMLSNFETSRAKLLQIVLAGQPQLAEKLDRAEMAQLRQRVSTVCRLSPFSQEETETYISHRLSVAGHRGPRLFTSAAVAAIHAASDGVPRTINHLCFNALSLCYALKHRQVDEQIVAEAIADQELVTVSAELVRAGANQRRPDPPVVRRRAAVAIRWQFAIGAVLVLACLAVWRTYQNRVRRAVAVPQGMSMPVPQRSLPSVPYEGVEAPPYIEVTVAPQQTITDIATQNLGGFSGTVLHDIKALNPKLSDPDHIEIGQKLRLPKRPPALTSQD
jgi:general secretion pathway protein A